MANAYTAVPIAITVEGANTLTRSLIQFGQGLTRSHPHLINVVKAIQHGDDKKGFYIAITKTIFHALGNLGRSIFRNITRERYHMGDPIYYYESQLSKLSANFAFASDLALTLGTRRLCVLRTSVHCDII